MKQKRWLDPLPLSLAVTVVGLLVLGPPAMAQTVIHTVGPCGDYDVIQQAIDAAAVGSDTEIRVQQGTTYLENLVIPKSFTSGSLGLVGGWDCDFQVADDDAGATTIDGDSLGPVVAIRLGGGMFHLQGFTLTHGEAERGAGVQVVPASDAEVFLESLRIVDNTAVSAGTASGGGVSAELDGNERLELYDLYIEGNRAISTGNAAVFGGGLSITATDNAGFVVDDCTVEDNSIESVGGNLYGGGIDVNALHGSQGELSDIQVSRNRVSGSLVIATGVHLKTSQTSILETGRLGIDRNSTLSGGNGPQVRVSALDHSLSRLHDSGIVGGDSRGIRAFALDAATLHLTNLTVADNADVGVDLVRHPAGVLTLYNTIAFGNSPDLSVLAAVDVGFNLIGVDPLFVDAGNLDYHVLPGSPAVNAGTNLPPGGLGSTDCEGKPRIVGGVVDIGMFEGLASVFSDGFEGGDTSTWSNTQP